MRKPDAYKNRREAKVAGFFGNIGNALSEVGRRVRGLASRARNRLPRGSTTGILLGLVAGAASGILAAVEGFIEVALIGPLSFSLAAVGAIPGVVSIAREMWEKDREVGELQRTCKDKKLSLSSDVNRILASQRSMLSRGLQYGAFGLLGIGGLAIGIAAPFLSIVFPPAGLAGFLISAAATAFATVGCQFIRDRRIGRLDVASEAMKKTIKEAAEKEERQRRDESEARIRTLELELERLRALEKKEASLILKDFIHTFRSSTGREPFLKSASFTLYVELLDRHEGALSDFMAIFSELGPGQCLEDLIRLHAGLRRLSPVPSKVQAKCEEGVLACLNQLEAVDVHRWLEGESFNVIASMLKGTPAQCETCMGHLSQLDIGGAPFNLTRFYERVCHLEPAAEWEIVRKRCETKLFEFLTQRLSAEGAKQWLLAEREGSFMACLEALGKSEHREILDKFLDRISSNGTGGLSTNLIDFFRKADRLSPGHLELRVISEARLSEYLRQQINAEGIKELLGSAHRVELLTCLQVLGRGDGEGLGVFLDRVSLVMQDGLSGLIELHEQSPTTEMKDECKSRLVSLIAHKLGEVDGFKRVAAALKEHQSLSEQLLGHSEQHLVLQSAIEQLALNPLRSANAIRLCEESQPFRTKLAEEVAKRLENCELGAIREFLAERPLVAWLLNHEDKKVQSSLELALSRGRGALNQEGLIKDVTHTLKEMGTHQSCLERLAGAVQRARDGATEGRLGLLGFSEAFTEDKATEKEARKNSPELPPKIPGHK